MLTNIEKQNTQFNCINNSLKKNLKGLVINLHKNNSFLI